MIDGAEKLAVNWTAIVWYPRDGRRRQTQILPVLRPGNYEPMVEVERDSET
jgi:hypothetical protein